MKTTITVVVGALAISMTGCSSPRNARVTRVEPRVAALEGVQGVSAARARVLVRALEQSPRAAEFEANGTVETLEMLAKVLDPPPPK